MGGPSVISTFRSPPASSGQPESLSLAVYSSITLHSGIDIYTTTEVLSFNMNVRFLIPDVEEWQNNISLSSF